MRKNFTPVIISLLAVLAVTSCVNKEYRLLGGIDATIGSDMTLVGPIGHTKTKLFEVLPDSFHSFAFRYDGEDVYLTKRDSEYIGNDIIDHIKMLPKGNFEIEAEIQIDPNDDKRGTFNETYDFVFDDINTNPNERLDSILLKRGNLVPLHIRSNGGTLIANSYGVLAFDSKDAIMDKDLYPENKQVFDLEGAPKDVQLDLGNAMVKFNGTKGFSIKAYGEVFSTEAIPLNSRVYITVDMEHLKPRVTYGYLGPDRVIYETTKTIDFAYTKDLEGGDYFLPFYNPQVFFREKNSIGIPAQYELDYIKLYNSVTGEEVYAEFNGSPSTTVVLNYPGINEIKGLSYSELQTFDVSTLIKDTYIECNREYGHTDRLFQIKGDYLEYHYKIRPLDTGGKGVSYFFDDSDIDMIFDPKLVCKFAGNKTDADKNFYIDRFDTLRINFDDLRISDTGGVNLSDDVMARIKLSYTNHLPVDADGSYWFIDDNNKAMMPELNGQLHIPAAKVGADGLVTAESEQTTAYIKFNYKQWKALNDKCKGMVFRYKAINKNLQDIWFKRNDWLEATADLWAKGYVSYNANKKEEKK